MITILGVLVSTGCVLASARRLQLATEASALDPDRLAGAIRARSKGDASKLCSALRQEIHDEPGTLWERDLFDALDAPDSARVALVNEQLAELDYRAQEWARVPRVCASISTSFGFLLAFAMVAEMANAPEVDLATGIVGAINVVAVGMAGAAFCIASQLRAAKIARQRLAATDRLVSGLEGLASQLGQGSRENRA